jgi:hypothetical protein
LAIALEDINAGAAGTFLLKGFVSTDYVDLATTPVAGEQLFIQRAAGRMTDNASWGGVSGTDLYRCIGYLMTDPTGSSGNIDVIRFDPSTDYIL